MRGKASKSRGTGMSLGLGEVRNMEMMEKTILGDLQDLAWRVACVGYGAPLACAILLPAVGGYYGLSVSGLVYAALLAGIGLVPVLIKYVKNDEHLQRSKLALEGLLARVHHLELLRSLVDAALTSQGFSPLHVELNPRGPGLCVSKKDPHAPCRHKTQLDGSEKRERELEWELRKEKESNKSMKRRVQRLQSTQQGRARTEGSEQQLLERQRELERSRERLDEALHIERRKVSKLQSELQRERNSRQVLEAQVREEKEAAAKLEEKVEKLNNERNSLRLRQAKKDGSGECAVCMKNKRQLLLRPCNHFCVCGECREILQGKCPICRKIIQRTERIYA